MDIFKVTLTKQAEHDLQKVPVYIAIKFQLWLELVEYGGLRTSRKIKSYHDEPLLGKRKKQRSIRLNKAYRAIYVEKTIREVELIEVQEVNKHDY